jgi:hypothetical protein
MRAWSGSETPTCTPDRPPNPPLAGLLLAEVEFDSAEALAAFQPPPWAHTEVTRDSRFTGGHLATATPANVSSALIDLGLPTLLL